MGHLQKHAAARGAERSRPVHWILFSIVAGAVLTGCASQDLEPPVAQMARAEAAIENAEQAGARDTAPLELQSARSHLSQAQRATSREEYQEALWLAEKAEADAELAEAKARTDREYETVAELKEGIRVLEDELQRQSPLQEN